MMLFGWLSVFSCQQQTAPVRSGAVVYQTYCTHCHQANGQGLPSRYPPLAGSEWLVGDMPIKILLHGLQGDITVKGNTFTNVMAPWGEVLSDEEIAGVITFVRSSWENSNAFASEPPVQAQDVAHIRKEFPHHQSWTTTSLIASETKKHPQ